MSLILFSTNNFSRTNKRSPTLSQKLSSIMSAFSPIPGLFGGSLMLTPLIGTEFIPPSDEGEVSVTGEMEVGTRLDLVDRQTQLLEQRVYAAVPEAVSSVVSVFMIGGWISGTRAI